MSTIGTRSKLTILTGLFLATVFFFSRPAIAQVGLQITNNRAVPDFPETIIFNLAAFSDSPIERITLAYGTNFRSCQSSGSIQNIQFDPGVEIDVEWEWELKRSGNVPPGAVVWWQWTLTDSGGISTTERQELLYIDQDHEWLILSREDITVYWFEGDSSFGQNTLSISLDELKRVSDQIGLSLEGEVQFWIYPTSAEVQESLVISQDWAGAVAFPNYNIMILSLAPGEDKWAAEVIPHELAHLVVGMAAFNCRGGHVPVWLNEGLSVIAEGPAEKDALDRIEKALQEENLLPLRTLNNGFSAYGGGARLAYAQSGEVVRFLLDEYGPELIGNLLTAIGDGLTIDRALEEVYGFDTDRLDATWRMTQGYAPTPTSAAVESMPTQVPTLVLVGPAVASQTAAPAKATIIKVPPSPNATNTTIPSTRTPSTEVASTAVAVVSQPEQGDATTNPSPPASGTVDNNRPPPIIFWAFGIGIFLVILISAGFILIRKGV